MRRCAPTPSPSTVQVSILGNQTSRWSNVRTAPHANSAGTLNFFVIVTLVCMLLPHPCCCALHGTPSAHVAHQSGVLRRAQPCLTRDADGMSVGAESDTTGGASARCRFCGSSPVLSRPSEDASPNAAVCRDCVVRLTKQFDDKIVGLTGLSSVESPGSFDAAVLWKRFDAAFGRFTLLHGFEVQVENGNESINSSWTCDSATNPPTRLEAELLLVRSFLERHGYREVNIVAGVDSVLAAKGELGNFYAVPDPADPRWTVRIGFDRRGGAPDVSV